METNYTTQLALSILFFAPGIILFAGLAFVGVLMILEKTVFQAQATNVLTNGGLHIELPANANPAPGAIVTALKDAQQPVEQKKQRKAHQ